jgi:hypothetical protein
MRSAVRLCWIKKAIVFAGGKVLHYLYLIAMTARQVWRTSGEIGEDRLDRQSAACGCAYHGRADGQTGAACCAHMRHVVAEGR